jgi:hypothetical protein
MIVFAVFAKLVFAHIPCYSETKPDYRLNRKPDNPLSGREFKAALRSRLSIGAARQPVNRTVREIVKRQRISIVLDRRIDRQRQIKRDIVDKSMLDALQQIAEDVGAAVSVVGDVVYIGPSESVNKIRTLIAIQHEKAESLDRKRQLEFSRSRPLNWSDLATPADILGNRAREYDLDVPIEKVPHDLWQWNSLARLDAFEAMALVLIQFDLMFELNDQGTGVSIKPVPNVVAIEKSYRVASRTTVAQAVTECQKRFGLNSAKSTGQQLQFTGTIEQHEIAALISRGRKPVTKSDTIPKSIPLSQREFSLPAQTVPAMALIEKLRESGVDIRFDTKQLKDAGVDLHTRIRLKFDKANINDVFNSVCEQVQARYSIDGSIVTITPK